ncbi:MOSC domain-containing protein [Streptomyces sp. NPDC102490]|uniref:MOSC domain-containing protein n=1 Tax=Streptomyces sp. NPDC102490 TaxID=3366183 RepID=UPI00380F9ADA
MPGQVAAVSRNEVYSFSKPNRDAITLLTGLGVEGDVHAGEAIRHQFRMTYEPDLPNLRQAHLMHEELFDELALKGFKVSAGHLGENINDFRKGLLGEVFAMDPASGEFTFKSGVMAVVRRGGTVRPDDSARVELPPLPHRPLERV